MEQAKLRKRGRQIRRGSQSLEAPDRTPNHVSFLDMVAEKSTFPVLY